MAEPTMIHSVVRALRLLDEVAESDVPVTAKQLASRTGTPLPTVYHLLRTLVHEDYLARTAAGYVIGDHVDRLRGTKVGGLRTDRAHEILSGLHADLGAAAYLSVLVDGEIQLRDIVDSPTAPRADLWVGFHDAAHATALGKAVLSVLPDDARRDYIESHSLEDLTPRTLTDRRALLRQLGTQSRFRLDREEYSLGTVCIAAPVPSARTMAAVAVSVPAHRGADVLARAARLTRAATLIALSTDEGAITI
ncbi:IclR family transcriptional regulator [Occultella kanbiaonis]|uniref:IclR family transcriptional regulator n=1 Tax=Occultella kanbiaonis TaxID=2675754 RepID=UPI001B3575B2|nr:IclR family transcriptional regulator C-terminal domain-containing protein [Occultella kanbiaonis]